MKRKSQKKYDELEEYLTSGYVTMDDVENADSTKFYDHVQSVYDYLDTLTEEQLQSFSKEDVEKGWIEYMNVNCNIYIEEV